MDISFFLISIFKPVSSTLDQFHPSDMSGFPCTLHKEACSTSASVSVEISFLIGFGGSGASNKFGEDVIHRYLLPLTELYKMFQHHLIWKGSFQKKLVPIYAYLSISDGVRSPFFFFGLAVWLQRWHGQKRTLPKPDQTKVRRLQVPTTLLPTPNSNMHSQCKSK